MFWMNLISGFPVASTSVAGQRFPVESVNRLKEVCLSVRSRKCRIQYSLLLPVSALISRIFGGQPVINDPPICGRPFLIPEVLWLKYGLGSPISDFVANR